MLQFITGSIVIVWAVSQNSVHRCDQNTTFKWHTQRTDSLSELDWFCLHPFAHAACILNMFVINPLFIFLLTLLPELTCTKDTTVVCSVLSSFNCMRCVGACLCGDNHQCILFSLHHVVSVCWPSIVCFSSTAWRKAHGMEQHRQQLLPRVWALSVLHACRSTREQHCRC